MHSAEYRHTETWPYHISAGGVIYRHQQGRLEVVVLYRTQQNIVIPRLGLIISRRVG